eukprot:356206-Chlamydomonas_euryale.AAC.3
MWAACAPFHGAVVTELPVLPVPRSCLCCAGNSLYCCCPRFFMDAAEAAATAAGAPAPGLAWAHANAPRAPTLRPCPPPARCCRRQPTQRRLCRCRTPAVQPPAPRPRTTPRLNCCQRAARCEA